jgi:hypothetical protein
MVAVANSSLARHSEGSKQFVERGIMGHEFCPASVRAEAPIRARFLSIVTMTIIPIIIKHNTTPTTIAARV